MSGVKRVIKIAEKGDDAARDSLSEGKSVVYTHTRCVEVPTEILKKNRVTTGMDNDEATAAYKLLRTQVLQRMTEQAWTTLAVTSAGVGEGNS